MAMHSALRTELWAIANTPNTTTMAMTAISLIISHFSQINLQP